MRELRQEYGRLWQEIQGCRRCLTAASIGPRLREEPVFIPVPSPRPPRAPVTYLLVAAEPSASWATSQVDAESKIAAGFRNFMGSRGDFALQYAVERWLLRPSEAYFITDLAKCAMSVAAAKVVGTKCYELCAPFLERELALLQPRAAIGIGRKAGSWLTARGLAVPVFQVVHYSPLGQKHWPKIESSAGLPKLDDLQAFIDQRRIEVPIGRPRPIAQQRDLRLLGVYRQQLTEIRQSVQGDAVRQSDPPAGTDI